MTLVEPRWKPAPRKQSHKSGFSDKVKAAVAEEFGGLCVLCPRPLVTYHHCFPRGMGGSPARVVDQWWNAAPICQACHDEVEHGKRTAELKRLLRTWATRRRETEEQDGVRPDDERFTEWLREKHPTR